MVAVRGLDQRSGSLFSSVDLERRIRADHPLRTIRTLVDEAPASLDGQFGVITQGAASGRWRSRCNDGLHGWLKADSLAA